jgi:hypothetical protein
MHDGFIMILEEDLNLLSYIYIKNKGLQCHGYLFGLLLHACSICIKPFPSQRNSKR